MGEPVDISVKLTTSGAVPEVVPAEKSAAGTPVDPTTIDPVCVVVLLPKSFVSVKDTSYVPSFTYVYEGSSRVLVFPSPNVQFHVVGDPVEASVNCTVRGEIPDVGVPEKLGTGTSAASV